MRISRFIRGIYTHVFQRHSAPLWVEISTAHPNCTYYFGPFTDWTEAETASPGYVADLETEGAQEIQVQIQRCHPPVLTICREPSEAA